MVNTKFIEDLSIKFSTLLKNTPALDVEKNFRALLEGAFTKLELVSREEFDIQADVLGHTRQKLQDMEERLAELEGMLQKDNTK